MSEINKEPIPEKEEIVHILKEDRDWQDAETVKPEAGLSVVLRIFNPNIICYQDDTHVYHLEDSVVGQWKEDHWEINPPFHKYNYSPLSEFNLMKEGTIVSHWAPCLEGEETGWEHRLDFFHKYEKLSINVDKEREEALYRAIMWGASFIEDAFNRTKDPKDEQNLREYYENLKDMQYAIDIGGIHEEKISEESE